MLAGRSPRFGPWIQAGILLGTLVLMALGCWLFVDAIATPDEVERWRAFAGAMLVSLAAEPFGVLLALALSRENDT